MGARSLLAAIQKAKTTGSFAALEDLAIELLMAEEAERVQRAEAASSASESRRRMTAALLGRILEHAIPEEVDPLDRDPLGTIARAVGKTTDRVRRVLFPYIQATAQAFVDADPATLKVELDIAPVLIEQALHASQRRIRRMRR